MHQTKQVLAKAARKLIAKRNVAEVHVSDICRQAGVSRQAFYNNFRDKQDLIAWVFQEMAPNFDAQSMVSAAALMMERIEQHRAFFRRALEDESQNSLYTFLRQYYIEKHMELIRQIRGTRLLPAALEVSIRIYCYGCVDMTREWLQDTSGTATSPDVLARRMYCALPALMKEAYGF